MQHTISGNMGNEFDGDKPKFDLVTASKTKKYKIIAGVILGLGILLLLGGILMRTLVTSAVTPNALTIVEKSLSGLEGTTNAPMDYTCTISQDESFMLSTSTALDRPLANPIKFELDNDAKKFLEIQDKNGATIKEYYYQGLFYLHIKSTANDGLDADGYLTSNSEEKIRPTGYLTIRCGSRALRIKFTYHKA